MGWRKQARKMQATAAKQELTKAFNSLSSCIYLTIDPQKHYCDPNFNPRRGTAATDKTCRAIAEAVPQLRDRKLRIGWVYTSRHGEGPLQAFGGWHVVTPKASDLVAVKSRDAAIPHPFDIHTRGDGNLHDLLRQEKKKTLLVGGFNLAACVEDTVKSALAVGYDVFIVADLCGNDRFSENHSIHSFRQEMDIYQSYLARRTREKSLPAPGNLHYTDSASVLKALKKSR